MKAGFSIKRVWLLIKANIAESASVVTYACIVASAIICIPMYLNNKAQLFKQVELRASLLTVNKAATEGQLLPFDATYNFSTSLFLIVGIMCFVAYVTFSNSTSKSKQSYKYALPASVPEKYSANAMVTLFLAPILALISLAIIALFITLVFKFIHGVEFINSHTIGNGIGNWELIYRVTFPASIFFVASSTIIGIWNSTAKGGYRIILNLIIAVVIVVATVMIPSIFEIGSSAFSAHYGPILALVSIVISYFTFKRKELKA